MFAADSHSATRDRIDATASAAGWAAPAWHRELNATASAVLGTADAMAAAARAAGLSCVHAEERLVHVGLTEPAQLVRYRFGHPAFAAWLDAIGPDRATTLAAEATRAIGTAMPAYRPAVVFLSALTRPR